ncbi:hypothetical protein [Neobacillus niacini]|uniref:hypothetical protein n=1 Tax=Neobacillus niacini TaxID=86668 RepID=UPI00351C556F
MADLDKTTYKRMYINELLKKYEPSTVRLFHRLFKVAVNAAVDSEIIPRKIDLQRLPFKLMKRLIVIFLRLRNSKHFLQQPNN